MAKLSKRAKANRSAVEGKENLAVEEAVALIKANAKANAKANVKVKVSA